MNAWDDLMSAIARFNIAERGEQFVANGLTYLGSSGPIFLAGDVRVRGLFVDRDERLWTDACLVVESAYLHTEAWEHYSDQPGGWMEQVYEGWVFSPERGRHNAIVAPLDLIQTRLDLHPLVPFPDGNWVRSWRTTPMLTDARLLELQSHGVPV